MIHINITKKIHTHQGIIDFNVDKSFNKGEFITISGKSGTGKTTLLRMIAGLTEPDSGTINVHDEIWFDSATRKNRTIQKRKCGFVFQETTLFPHMTVLQNILYAHNDKKLAYELLELLEITALAERLPAKLSGGQKQRVAIARALAIKPEILLLDEPFSSLDMNLKSIVQDELKRVHERFGTLMMLVTHDYTDIFKLSTRTLYLTPGTIERDGSAYEVYLNQLTSHKFSFTGKILDIQKNDLVYNALIGSTHGIIETIVTEDDVKDLIIGDMVHVGSKSFSPVLHKLGVNLLEPDAE